MIVVFGDSVGVGHVKTEEIFKEMNLEPALQIVKKKIRIIKSGNL